MNILLLSQFFSTTRGGGEYVFSLMAKKFAENNHKVWVITNKKKGEIRFSHADISLAKKELGFFPKIELKDGIKNLLNAYFE